MSSREPKDYPCRDQHLAMARMGGIRCEHCGKAFQEQDSSLIMEVNQTLQTGSVSEDTEYRYRSS